MMNDVIPLENSGFFETLAYYEENRKFLTS